MNILGVDIGFKNVGLILTHCVREKVEPLFVKKVDLSHYKCTSNCNLYHTNDLADLISHFVVQYKDIFDKADQIVIERQPPGGLKDVESLLYYIFRDKSILISPVSMHKHFGMGHLDYEGRKERTEQIASHYLKDDAYFMNLERKHDIADALCMVLFQNHKNCLLFRKNKERQNKTFEEFMFVPENNIQLN